MRTASGLWVEEGGTDGDPVLLLMHGLSGTGEVWTGLRSILREKWPGRWIVPDMRGHGRSAHCGGYGIGCHAADMAALLEGADAPYLAGHSMGGLVGILMASGWFGVTPAAVLTVGVKVDWKEEEHSAIDRLVETPARWFETEQEARERFVLVTGLTGIVDPASDAAASGIAGEAGRWRLAADNRAAMVARADARSIYAAARAPVILAAGERDRMVSATDLRTLDPNAIELGGLGHNAHVEDPSAFWALIAGAAGVGP